MPRPGTRPGPTPEPSHGATSGSRRASRGMERRHPAHRRACVRARAGKSPYDKTYVEECRIRAEAFFKEKEERKKAEELIKTQLAAEEAAASKVLSTPTRTRPWP